jgi:P4 family phage/plasmid primase-like protien
MKIWVCFIITENNGKTNKKPISANGTKTGSDSAYAHTWVTYDEAVKAMQERGYDAVGFSVPNNMGFLDMDHMNETDPFVQIRLDRFNSYTERSVSGNGIHIYFKMDPNKIPTYEKDSKLKLDKAYYQKNPKNNIEIYFGAITNRFSVFTGNAIKNVPVRDCTDAALKTLEKDMLKNNSASKKSGVKTVIFDGDTAESEYWDIICKLRKQKNGEKFCRLYDEGDFSDYGSHSEADCALCAMIAFRVGADNKAIDKIFRGSKLYREKWERDDYREETIEKGIEACHGTFHRTLMPHPDFIRFNEMTGQPYVVVPLLAEHVREHTNYLLVRDSGKQGLLKYVYEDGVYKLYADEMFKGCIKQFIEDYDPELVKIGQVNEAYQHILTDRSYISQDELNAREDIINFRNGILIVNEHELRLVQHSPDYYSTIQIPCKWRGEKSDTTVFENYLRTLTNGNNAVARLLLQFMGACISNVKGWRMKKSLFLVGDGDTGKSQLKSLVEKLLGKGNFIGTDLSEIEARFGTGTIYGTRLAGSSDMSFMTVSELKTFKKITGGDSLFAEFKGQQGFEFTYNGLLWFCMNRLPKFGGDDGKWVYNRIMVVNCPNVIPLEKQDKRLLDKLYAEREGIIYLAVRALQKVIRNGCRFDEPESVIQAREDYMTSNNTVIAFFNECMCERRGEKIADKCTTGKVYKIYREWCFDNNGGFAKTAKEFRDTLCSHLGTTYEEMTKRSGGNTYYADYTLTLETKKQYGKVYGYDSSVSVDDDFFSE